MQVGQHGRHVRARTRRRHVPRIREAPDETLDGGSHPRHAGIDRRKDGPERHHARRPGQDIDHVEIPCFAPRAQDRPKAGTGQDPVLPLFFPPSPTGASPSRDEIAASARSVRERGRVVMSGVAGLAPGAGGASPRSREAMVPDVFRSSRSGPSSPSNRQGDPDDRDIVRHLWRLCSYWKSSSYGISGSI